MFFFSAGTSSSLPTREGSGLGVIKLKGVNTKFTEKERFLIGTYTAINGSGAAVRESLESLV